MSNNAQEQFDSIYVTSSEIAKSLNITRSAMCQAIARGALPSPIKVNGGQITLYVRKEVEPFLAAWKLVVKSKQVA